MKNYLVIFTMRAFVTAEDERDAREIAALRLCQLTPNDMACEVVDRENEFSDEKTEK